MRDTAQVVVIGGGVVGASVLYHLTKAGWTDVVLVERTELTAGSTWHSAGGMHTLNGDPNVAKLQQYTIELYKEIEEASGQDCSIHITGGVMLADTAERMDWLRMSHARGRYLGMDTELISVAEAKELLPIFEEKHFVGAMYDAHEGHVDPTGVTNAYAKAARQAGAEIYRDTWARDLNRNADGTWRIDLIKTSTGEDAGHITCDHVVNAGGLWAREVGRMAGIEAPILAMEHIYIVTEPLDEVAKWNADTGTEMLHAIDFGGEIYMRQEQGGLLLGTYEPNGRPWSIEETPWEFGMQLLEPNLDYIAESLQRGFDHFPIFASAGIKSVINGPFTFSPDGNPLLGPVRGLPGYWSACAVMAGLSQGGGVGLALANWITEGDPGFDVWAMDISRYGDYASMAWTNTKVRENYGRRFRIRFPNEFLTEGRPLATTPIYDKLVDANAVWGDSFGLETAQWFQKPGLEPVEEFTFGRSNAWDQVRAETLTVRNGVGLIETSGFSKFEFSGSGARDFLDELITNTMPKPGRMVLAPMTNEAGKLIGDLTVACPEPAIGVAEGPKTTITGGATANTDSDERFFVFGSGIAERFYQRWFDQQLAQRATDGSVRYQTHSWELCGLSIAGPKSRELLEKVTRSDVSADALPFMGFREIEIGWAKVWCGRVSYSGDLGFEFWMPSSMQRYVFDTLMEAGAELGIGLFGSAALNSLRLEKGFGSWAREFRPLYTPFEAGLDRFVKLDSPSKGDFVGRDALVAAAADGPTLRLLTWTVEADQHDVIGDEPVWHQAPGTSEWEVVGWVTSGGYAHHGETSVAMGYVPAALETAGGDFEIEIVGVRHKATVVDGCLWDPKAARMRG